MKKLLLLALVVLGGVSTVSAWNDMYLICKENNNWNVDTYGANFKFVKVDDTHYRATVPGSYINNGNWNFRFREQNGSWWNIGPMGSEESDNTEVTETAVQTNYQNSSNASFYISQNASASFVQIFIEWADPYWNVTASVITDKYTVMYVNPDCWNATDAYAFYNVDNCAEQYPLGTWSGSPMTQSGVHIFTIEVPAISGGKIIFNHGGVQYPASNGFDIVENGVYGKTGLLNSQAIAEVPVTIGNLGYATFSSAYPVDFTNVSGVTAYRAEQTSAKEVLLKKVTGAVAACTGLVLKGDPGSYTIPTATSGTIYNRTSSNPNYLVASVAETTITPAGGTSEWYYFLSSTETSGVGFYNLANDETYTSVAGKAFYQTNTALTTGPTSRAAWIIEGEETQGINTVESTQNADVVYDLQGRVAKTAKAGLYIKNGKKVIMK